MINQGSKKVKAKKDGWIVVMRDKKISVQSEYTIELQVLFVNDLILGYVFCKPQGSMPLTHQWSWRLDKNAGVCFSFRGQRLHLAHITSSTYAMLVSKYLIVDRRSLHYHVTHILLPTVVFAEFACP